MSKRNRRSTPMHKNASQLKFIRQPPPFPILKEHYEIIVAGPDGEKGDLEVFLVHEKEQTRKVEPQNGTIRSIETSPPILTMKNGFCQFSCLFNHLSAGTEDFDRFILCVCRKDSSDVLYSLPIKVVQYQLLLTSRLEDEWMRDKGGKKNVLEMHVRLVTENSLQPVLGFPVHYNVELLYENGMQVKKPGVLKLTDTSKQTIDSETGEAHIQCRITEVSNKHKKQRFRLRIVPDVSKDPSLCNVAPTMSNPVLVKSKVNVQKIRAQQQAAKLTAERAVAKGKSKSEAVDEAVKLIDPFGDKENGPLGYVGPPPACRKTLVEDSSRASLLLCLGAVDITIDDINPLVMDALGIKKLDHRKLADRLAEVYELEESRMETTSNTQLRSCNTVDLLSSGTLLNQKISQTLTSTLTTTTETSTELDENLKRKRVYEPATSEASARKPSKKKLRDMATYIAHIKKELGRLAEYDRANAMAKNQAPNQLIYSAPLLNSAINRSSTMMSLQGLANLRSESITTTLFPCSTMRSDLLDVLATTAADTTSAMNDQDNDAATIPLTESKTIDSTLSTGIDRSWTLSTQPTKTFKLDLLPSASTLLGNDNSGRRTGNQSILPSNSVIFPTRSGTVRFDLEKDEAEKANAVNIRVPSNNSNGTLPDGGRTIEIPDKGNTTEELVKEKSTNVAGFHGVSGLSSRTLQFLENSAVDKDVRTILLKDTADGLPSFDCNGKLVGFYRLSYAFEPLESIQTTMSDEHFLEMRSQLQEDFHDDVQQKTRVTIEQNVEDTLGTRKQTILQALKDIYC